MSYLWTVFSIDFAHTLSQYFVKQKLSFILIIKCLSVSCDDLNHGLF